MVEGAFAMASGGAVQQGGRGGAGASWCVGRVGGLAVASGVGVGLFAGSGVAWADRSAGAYKR